jgi:PTH1 family peptidyl-tRNA hydrolase
MKLFVGLGNPGKGYARHRHNVGFMVLERIAQRHGLGPWKKRYHGLVAEGPIGGRRVMLLMPQTFMNDSGQAVGEAQRYLKIDEGDIYVFHDEIDLAPGKLRVKVGGGNAGHNGLRSISAHIGNEYARVRIGVGHPGSKDAVVHYVLHDFSKADQEWLEPMLDGVAEAAGRLAAGDEARFLTDVARRLQPAQTTGASGRKVKSAGGSGAATDEDGEGKAEKAPAVAVTAAGADAPAPAAEAPRKAGAPPRAASRTAVPAQAQRGSSLAENLKRWLRGRG